MGAWEANVRKVVPYVPGEQPNMERMIKLNTNENPYPPSPKVAEVLDNFQKDCLRLYPDPSMDVLVSAIAKRYQLDKKQVFVGVGSDDVLSMAFLAFFNSKKPILFPDITYSFYDVWAAVYHIPYEQIAVDQELHIIKEAYYKENGGVVLANPNAPSGIYEPLETIEGILEHNRDCVVIVDEAYIDFGGQSALPLIEKYDNLLVVQTFSKSRSMAGTRIGYAMGSEKLISYLYDIKESINSYTMNQFALQVGVASVEDEAYFQSCCEKVVRTRERVKTELAKLGFEFPDSYTNFIFAKHPRCDAKELFEALKKAGIFVRYFAKPRIDQYLRITIGTDEQMDLLLEFLKDYLKQKSL